MWAGVKLVLKLLRIATYRKVLKDTMTEGGYIGAYMTTRPPKHAEWRWQTATLCLNYILPVIEGLVSTWTSNLLKSCRRIKLAIAARNTLLNTIWQKQLCVAYDITEVINSMRTWGGGCACHDALRLQGGKVQCNEQGKRLPEVPARRAAYIAQCRACIEQPQANQMCAVHDIPESLELDRQTAFQHARMLGDLQTAFYEDLPYRLGLVVTGHDLALARIQWEELPLHRRQRVENYLFDPTGPFV